MRKKRNFLCTIFQIILLICLLIFGAGKLPEIGKSIGKTIKEFKKSIKGIESDDEEEKKQ